MWLEMLEMLMPVILALKRFHYTTIKILPRVSSGDLLQGPPSAFSGLAVGGRGISSVLLLHPPSPLEGEGIGEGEGGGGGRGDG
jgi:hypothetical protein